MTSRGSSDSSTASIDTVVGKSHDVLVALISAFNSSTASIDTVVAKSHDVLAALISAFDSSKLL